MRFLDMWQLRLRSMLRRSRVEQELSAELEFHLEQQIAENLAAGIPPDEARRAALRTVGNLESFKEECRDVRGVEWMTALLRDFRFGLRTLGKERGFAAVAVLSLALGIGVNTALFSIVDAVLLKSLPVAEPERLVVIERVNPSGEKDSISYPLFEEVRDRVPAFSGVFAAQRGTDRVEALLPDGRGIVEADLRLVSAGYFEVLGVRPALGRVLTAVDHTRGLASPGVVVSERFWTSRLHRDPSILGKPVVISKQPFTIVGVSPAEFFGEAAGQSPDVWAPVEAQPALSRGMSLLEKANVSWLAVMARLKPGVDQAQGRAALSVFLAQLRAEPGRVGEWGKGVRDLALSAGMRGLDDLRLTYSRPLRVLMVIVAVVLLIACANVANLLLARGAQRQREIAIRLALGARRMRIFRQLMTENLCIAGAGGALGVLLAIWATRSLLLLVSQRPEPLPLHAGVDGRVLVFTVCVSVVCCLLFGLLPAIQATRSGASLTVTGSRRPRQIIRYALVTAQVAMSVVLLAAAGLFLRTLHNLRAQDLGFQPERLLQVRIDPQGSGYKPAELPEVYGRVLRAVRGAPGVQSASMSHSGFNTGMSRTCCLAVEGRVFGAGEQREVRTNSVRPDYFETVGLPLLLGRSFSANEIADPPRAAILSRSAAQRYFGTESPIGRRIGWGDPPQVTYGIEVIGVVDDVKTGDLREEMRPILYFASHGGRVIQVRTSADPAAAATAIRQAILKADSSLPVRGIQTVRAVIDSSLVVERLMSTLAAFFGLLALCLAAIGLYGVIDYSVRRRTQEIGLRMAMGARPGRIIGMITREVGVLLAAGIVLGVVAVLACGQLLRAMLYGIEASDPVNIAAAAVVLAATGLLAAIVPGRRATAVNPVIALRCE